MPPSPLRTGVGLPEEYAALPEGLPVIRASRKMNRDAAVAPSLLPLTEPQKQGLLLSLLLKSLSGCSEPLHLLRSLSRSSNLCLPRIQLRCHLPKSLLHVFHR